ncbi:hypothetical protein I2I05_18955 [Hymenobacter sp. BT683]|uniref:DUF4279 domain-containing protein n=1 Tax=Hymenobacter jeongseonensis TaxID=2791027 RepID=A0ABS0INX7_9BACT|nr:hypothetical protein [Hymenobacter jeongseonensis]MBF9239480.1 hypothetical protein [Hymenobacter jeongseonensis]
MDPHKLPDFIDYFRQLAGANRALAGSFVHGSAGRIISGSRSGMTYPCLWLETPTLGFSEKDGTAPLGRRQCAFVVLQDVPSDDYDAQDAGWAASEQIALDVLSRMVRDRKKRKFSFTLNERPLEPIATLTVDNEIGWRFEFELSSYVEMQYEPSRWADEEGGQGA